MNAFSLPTAGSTMAQEVDALFTFLTVLSVVLFTAITVIIVWFAVRYRRTSAAVPTNPVVSNVPLEIAWMVIPGILLAVIFAWGFGSWLKMRVVPAEPLDIRVSARQWAWSFTYPDSGIVSGDLVVPANQVIKLTMTSADVIHSFYVPEFRVKQDVLPERIPEPSSDLAMDVVHVLFGEDSAGDAALVGHDHEQPARIMQGLE